MCDYWFWVGGGHFSHSDKWLLGCQKAWTSVLVSYIYTLPESDVLSPEDLRGFRHWEIEWEIIL